MYTDEALSVHRVGTSVWHPPPPEQDDQSPKEANVPNELLLRAKAHAARAVRAAMRWLALRSEGLADRSRAAGTTRKCANTPNANRPFSPSGGVMVCRNAPSAGAVVLGAAVLAGVVLLASAVCRARRTRNP